MPPKEPKSIDEMRAAFERGEIVRGDKGDTKLAAPDGTEITYYKETGRVNFIHRSGCVVDAEVNSLGRVGNIQLTEAETGNPYRDIELSRKIQNDLNEWSNQGLFDTD